VAAVEGAVDVEVDDLGPVGHRHVDEGRRAPALLAPLGEVFGREAIRTFFENFPVQHARQFIHQHEVRVDGDTGTGTGTG